MEQVDNCRKTSSENAVIHVFGRIGERNGGFRANLTTFRCAVSRNCIMTTGSMSGGLESFKVLPPFQLDQIIHKTSTFAALRPAKNSAAKAGGIQIV